VADELPSPSWLEKSLRVVMATPPSSPICPANACSRHAPGDALDAHVRRVDGERPAAGRASSQRQVQARIDSRHQAGSGVDDGVLAQQHGLARRRDVGGPDCGVSHPTLLKNAATECKSFGASGQ